MGTTVDLGEHGTVDLGFDIAESKPINQYADKNALRQTTTEVPDEVSEEEVYNALTK